MSIIIGYNGSDVTYGWNGRMSGFTLHYSHFTGNGHPAGVGRAGS